MKFESSEYDGDENEADLCEGKAGGLNENESEVSGGSSGKDRSQVEGDSAEIVLSGDEENPEIILKKMAASER